MYKTLYVKYNPNYEYQRQNGVWFKRLIGTKEMWIKVDAKGQDILNKGFKDKNIIFFYSDYFLVGSALVISVLSYLAYTKLYKKQK